MSAGFAIVFKSLRGTWGGFWLCIIIAVGLLFVGNFLGISLALLAVLIGIDVSPILYRKTPLSPHLLLLRKFLSFSILALGILLIGIPMVFTVLPTSLQRDILLFLHLL